MLKSEFAQWQERESSDGKPADGDDLCFPHAFRDCETKLVSDRRSAAGWSDEELEQPPVGVGISGGGIRSATFALGVFQSLCRASLLPRVDYLSTVSGGGYFGGFLGRLITRDMYCQPGTALGKAQQDITDCQSPPIKWLRENGRYLAPNGAGDLQTGIAVALRNWLATQLVMAAFFFAVFACGAWFDSSMSFQKLGMRTIGESLPWLQPSVLLPVGALLLFVIPLCVTYWLIPEESLPSIALPMAAVVAISAFGGLIWWIQPQKAAGVIALLLAAGNALSLPWLGVLWLRTTLSADGGWLAGELQRRQYMRNRASDWLGWSLAFTLGLAVFASLDMAGAGLGELRIAGSSTLLSLFGGIITLLGTLASFAHKVLAILGGEPGKPRIPSRFQEVVLTLVAVAVALVLLLFVAFLAHFPTGLSPAWEAAFALVVSCAFGHTQRLANRSSFEPLYQARLTRAYLGASNPARTENAGNSDVTDVIPGDGIAFADYAPHTCGGPLHIVNVTLNETVDGRSNIEQRDRKGLPMGVGPCGISVGTSHHAEWTPDRRGLKPVASPAGYSIFEQRGVQAIEPESLDLGHWLAISGAAVSTGAGANTSLGASLLCGLANARLGYWWDSGISPRNRIKPGVQGVARRLARLFAFLFPVQSSLADEWLSRFHGPNRRLWNLSDGGHFENLAGYELIRRKLPLIILVDAEQDPEYTFSGLANLVRKARVDFSAEIRFLGNSDLDAIITWPDRQHFGTLDDLRPSPNAVGKANENGLAASGFSRACAAVAEIDYGNGDRGTLVYIKACLTGAVPVDLLQYKASHCAL